MDISGICHTIEYEKGWYDIYVQPFNDTYIYSICKYNARIPNAQLIQKNQQLVLSHTSDDYMANILYSFIYTRSHNIIQSRNASAPLMFRSAKHVFTAHVKREIFHYYLTIGGSDFHGCIEMFIPRDISTSTISQIYAEPECAYDSPLGSKDTVDMIKAALQFVQTLFNVSVFTFNDNSQIECLEKEYTKPPPRKIKKPLSLTYLYIIDYNETWYERNFNAFLIDPKIREKYVNAKTRLLQNVDISLEQIATRYFWTDEVYHFLKTNFTKGSYIDLLRCIPKHKRCDWMTWAPRFMSDIMDFDPTKFIWKIALAPIYDTILPEPKYMIRTSMIILPFGYLLRGGGKRTLTHKRRTYDKPCFTNSNPVSFTVEY